MSRTLAVENLNHNTDLKSSLAKQLYTTLTDVFSGTETVLFGLGHVLSLGKSHSCSATVTRQGCRSHTLCSHAAHDRGCILDNVGTMSNLDTLGNSTSTRLLVNCIDCQQSVAVAQDSTNSPFKSVFGFGREIGSDKVNSLPPTAFFSLTLEVEIITTDDLTNDTMSRGGAVDGGYVEREALGTAQIREMFLVVGMYRGRG
jgi:hypothetical protein